MPNLQVDHLLLGPLCLLGHQGGRLVLDLPLAHESRGPHEDLEVPPSRVPLRVPQVLELPNRTQKETQEAKWKQHWRNCCNSLCLRGTFPSLTGPFFLLDNQSFCRFKQNTAADSFPRRKPKLFAITCESLLKVYAEINLNFQTS